MPTDVMAFWSYTHFDDANDEKAIGWLCNRLAEQVRVASGQPFKCYIDKEDLEWGEKWETSIEDALDRSYLLIVVVTPSYFRSRACKVEFERFRTKERVLERDDLILPIYYVTADEIETPEMREENPWARWLYERQYVDWRPHRFKRRNSPAVRRTVFAMAKRIKVILNSVQEQLETSSWSGQPWPSQTTAEVIAKDKLEQAFEGLTQTQRYIVQYMYNDLPVGEIPVDDLHAKLCEMYGNDVMGRPKELHYRARDLAHAGLIRLRRVGPQTTLVIALDEVGQLLFRRGLRPT